MAWMCPAERHRMEGLNVRWSTLRLRPGEARTKNEERTWVRRIPTCAACETERSGVMTGPHER